jgi:hypothetical protein
MAAPPYQRLSLVCALGALAISGAKPRQRHAIFLTKPDMTKNAMYFTSGCIFFAATE